MNDMNPIVDVIELHFNISPPRDLVTVVDRLASGMETKA